jgi:hypothetical protein
VDQRRSRLRTKGQAARGDFQDVIRAKDQGALRSRWGPGGAKAPVRSSFVTGTWILMYGIQILQHLGLS